MAIKDKDKKTYYDLMPQSEIVASKELHNYWLDGQAMHIFGKEYHLLSRQEQMMIEDIHKERNE